MNTLIVFEVIPEETIFAIVPMTEEEFNHYSRVSGLTVNLDELTDEQQDIHDEISNNLTEGNRWYPCKVSSKHTDLSQVDRMINLGFYL